MTSSIDSVLSTDSLILLGILLIQGLIGFINPVYFITLGYGNSINFYGITVIILTVIHARKTSWNIYLIQIVIQGVMYIAYGLRMMIFIFMRNRNQNYRQSRDGQMKIDARFFKRVMLWLSVELLYYSYCMSALIGLTAIKGHFTFNSLMHWVGMGIMAVGLLFESVGDYQKSRSKRVNPNRFCDSGIYRIVRMPNYFGEMTFWIGSYLCGIGDTKSILQIILGSMGVLFAIMLMIGAAMRLERNQDEHYRDNPEYYWYRNSTPILFPLLPIYSLSCGSKTD